MTVLTQKQKDVLNLFNQKIKNSIKESKVNFDTSTFQPFKNIVLKIPLDVMCDASVDIPREILYAELGKLVWETKND